MNRLVLNGCQFVSGEPTLQLQGPCNAHNSMHITATAVSSSATTPNIFLPLPLCIGNVITGVTIYYQTTNSRSYIVATEIVQQTFPDTQTEPFGDSTQLSSTTPAAHTCAVPNLTVGGNDRIMLRLYFANTADIIKIGAVEIDYN